MKVLLISLVAALLLFFVLVRLLAWAMAKNWFWNRAIRKFEQSDRRSPPRLGLIVFTGSSSINFWKTLAQDMAPLRVLNRGFGGSHMAHVTHFAGQIVLPYQPSAIVGYAGENDVSKPWLKTPESVLQDFREFVQFVHQRLPATWIYFISVKPTPMRWKLWDKQQLTNQLIEDFCQTSPQLEFIDVTKPMLDSSGKPRLDLFKWDGLHPSPQCYALWRSILHPILMERFALVSADVKSVSPASEATI